MSNFMVELVGFCTPGDANQAHELFVCLRVGEEKIAVRASLANPFFSSLGGSARRLLTVL